MPFSHARFFYLTYFDESIISLEMSKNKDFKIKDELLIKLYLESHSKSELFRKLGIPDNTTWRRWLAKKQNLLNLQPFKKGVFKSKSQSDDISFEKIVKESFSIRESLIRLGLKPCGGNYSIFKKRVEELSIDISHFKGKGHLRNSNHNWGNSRNLDEILKESSHFNSYRLKNKLFKAGLLKNECNICGITEWQGMPISLHLDHINGINNDNRIENLRILCPNCHSQTSTYAGKNKNKIGVVGLEPTMPCG